MKTFEELVVWQKAHTFVLEIYRVTKHFPVEERYGLIAQLRRAAVSIPANIVEGHKRASKREFVNFLSIADASLEECKYYLVLARHLGWIEPHHFAHLFANAEEIGRLLCGLRGYVKQELTNADTVPSLTA